MASGHLEFLHPDRSPLRVFKIGIAGEGARRGHSKWKELCLKFFAPCLKMFEKLKVHLQPSRTWFCGN